MTGGWGWGRNLRSPTDNAICVEGKGMCPVGELVVGPADQTISYLGSLVIP